MFALKAELSIKEKLFKTRFFRNNTNLYLYTQFFPFLAHYTVVERIRFSFCGLKKKLDC